MRSRVKAEFLKDIITGKVIVSEISSDFAFEQLSHMKGGPSIKVLLDLALGDNDNSQSCIRSIKNSSVSLRG